jgi:hypothetical protein
LVISDWSVDHHGQAEKVCGLATPENVPSRDPGRATARRD